MGSGRWDDRLPRRNARRLPLEPISFKGRPLADKVWLQEEALAVPHATLATNTDRPLVANPSSLSSIVVGFGDPFDSEEKPRTFGPAHLSKLIDDAEELGMFLAKVPSEDSTRLIPGDSGGALLLSSTEDKLIGVPSAADGSQRALYADLTAAATSTWLARTLASLDRDNDGIPDSCDMCPDAHNGGPDDDGDGVPNACDLCPCDSDEADPWQDGDEDGVCGACLPKSGFCAAYCVDATVDNCPDLFNSDQSNANAFAEGARLATVLGDRCDPVPSPIPSAVYDLEVTTGAYGPAHFKKVKSQQALRYREGLTYRGIPTTSARPFCELPVLQRDRCPDLSRSWSRRRWVAHPAELLV